MSQCQKCKGTGRYWTTLRDIGGHQSDGMGVDTIVSCDFPGCHNGIVDREENYRITNG